MRIFLVVFGLIVFLCFAFAGGYFIADQIIGNSPTKNSEPLPKEQSTEIKQPEQPKEAPEQRQETQGELPREENSPQPTTKALDEELLLDASAFSYTVIPSKNNQPAVTYSSEELRFNP
ncbi:hypothetical protein [Desulforamulus ruminis]|uniref:Uncharacterized protein n=1 Tax=Desulforamulus ruminis (strain ATCC 23193 / DSM 2154 / NCIMB 8452 / DL) TaxID=696281 RepID=F6DU20_DESRL|nr:hypothetical protein [Desulforamulus ruminis]AEG60095.1 hypothetical protein Desru_1833 [Desulforamulus ruminis DSM 2154]